MKPPFVTYVPIGKEVEVLSWTADDMAMIKYDDIVKMVPISDLNPNPRRAFYLREMEQPRWVP